MKRLMKYAVWMAVAVLAIASVAVTVADEPASNNLQGSWNDLPAKSTGFSGEPQAYGPPAGDTAQPEHEQYQTRTPPVNWFQPQGPRQQQQGKPSGGGFAWGGGKTGGSGFFGGKQGGSFNWGKVPPPQSQQGVVPRPPGGGPANPGQINPGQAQLREQIQLLQQQNAYLQKILESFAQRQPGMNSESSTATPNSGEAPY